jgi:hypothetical protein
MNVLEDIAWVRTKEGLKTVRQCFEEPSTELETNLLGYEYGVQIRFLMTIFPVLVALEPARGKKGVFSSETLDSAFNLLRPHADLFDSENPFLQITESFIEGKILAEMKGPSKLIPHGQGPEDKQSIFWNFSAVKDSYPLSEAVPILLSYYFYGPGTNTFLLKEEQKDSNGTFIKLERKQRLQLKNGSSALQYTSGDLTSTEIVLLGNDLIDTLRLNTPANWIKPGVVVLPHWANRKATLESINDLFWRFSWSSNTAKLYWSDQTLIGVVRGGIPLEWLKDIPKNSNESWEGKNFHSERQVEDPLYLHVRNSDGEDKQIRLALGADPNYSISRWHAEDITKKLADKIDTHLLPLSKVRDIVFLEHSTGGTSLSFSIRYSRTIEGFKEEFLPDNKEVERQLFYRFSDVLSMRSKITGMFSEKGTMSHLQNLRGIAEQNFWNEVQDLTVKVLHEPIPEDEWRRELKKSAIIAFEKTSSMRNTIHIKAHISGLRNIQGIQW